jgi:fumarylacetoacetate (FAA) hydrolase
LLVEFIANKKTVLQYCKKFTFLFLKIIKSMKLASYKDGSKDGQLVVVSKDLSLAHYTTGIVHSLQEALEDWNFIGPQLQDLYDQLNFGKTKYHFAFQAGMCRAPLARAYQHLYSSNYIEAQSIAYSSSLAPTETNSASINQALPQLKVYQLSGDTFLGPKETLLCRSQQLNIDLYPQISVLLGDVEMGCGPEQALESIRFLMLSQQVVFDQLKQQEIHQSTSFMQSRGPTCFSSVAISLDELNDYWKKGKAYFQVQMHRNGKRVSQLDTGPDMLFHFGEVISFVASTRSIPAGTVLSCGPIAQLPESLKKQNDLSAGFSAVADKRSIEQFQESSLVSDFYQFNDEVKLDAKDSKGQSIFGTIQLSIKDIHEVVTVPNQGAKP